MPLLTQDKAIKQYFEEVKDKYPNVNFDQFYDICKAPFNFFKEQMLKGTLPIIKIKHIGRFLVFPSRIKRKMLIEKMYLDEGKITKERYDHNIEFLTNYLKDLQYEHERRSNLPIKRKTYNK